ncbi:rhodanese-like domain-containing protein [Crenobacter cavernae]|nr:rhodanese-like domain-containing protein [Crenobacter cavernae]
MKRMLALLFACAMGLAQAAELVDGRLVVDVRTHEEYASGHVKGALSAPVDKVGDIVEQVAPDRGTPITLYCRSGRRSEQALQALQSRGYHKLENLGGLEDAVKRYGPLVR